MRFVISFLVIWSTIGITTGMAAETDPAKIAEEGIRQFYRDAASNDEKVSTAAFKSFLIDETGLQKLYGKEDGSKIWAFISKVIENPEVLQKMKQEIVQKGPVQKLELIDVRKDDASKRYQQILTVIPADVPVYRAIITTEKGAAGSSSYVVINNQVRFVRGLESMLEALKQQQSK